jgi:hypothetical protein
MDVPSPIKHEIAKERLRQAQKAFDLAFGATMFTTAISLIGAISLFTGKVHEGTVTTVGGLATSIHCMRLAKDANDRLDKLLVELNENQ